MHIPFELQGGDTYSSCSIIFSQNHSHVSLNLEFRRLIRWRDPTLCTNCQDHRLYQNLGIVIKRFLLIIEILIWQANIFPHFRIKSRCDFLFFITITESVSASSLVNVFVEQRKLIKGRLLRRKEWVKVVTRSSHSHSWWRCIVSQPTNHTGYRWLFSLLRFSSSPSRLDLDVCMEENVFFKVLGFYRGHLFREWSPWATALVPWPLNVPACHSLFCAVWNKYGFPLEWEEKKRKLK